MAIHSMIYNNRNFIDHFFYQDFSLLLSQSLQCFIFSSQVNDIPKSSSKVTRDESKLDPQVAKFISLICNVTMMAQQMMELGWSLSYFIK